MAQLLNLQTAAERHLAQYDTVIASLKPRFIHRGARPVLWHPCLIRGICWYLARTVCSVTCWTNTIPNARQGETNFWGSTAVGIDRLAAYKDVDVLCFDHGNDKEMDALMSTPLWQAMPFVRAGRFQRVPAVWFYGATLSAMHFARILDTALGGKA